MQVRSMLHLGGLFLLGLVFRADAVLGQSDSRPLPKLATESCLEQMPAYPCKQHSGSFRPLLKLPKTQFAVNEPVPVVLGSELTGYVDTILNPFLEPQWPVCLFIAVYADDGRYFGRFSPSGAVSTDVPPNEAYLYPQRVTAIGANLVIQPQDWTGENVLTRPGFYFLQVIATRRMFADRPGGSEEVTSQNYLKRWKHPLWGDVEACRSEPIKIELTESKTPGDLIPIISQEATSDQLASFVSKISSPEGKPMMAGQYFNLKIQVENPSKETLYLFDPNCIITPRSGFRRVKLNLSFGNDPKPVRDMFVYAMGGGPPATVIRLPPNGMCEAQISVYNQLPAQACALQLEYGADVFLTKRAWDAYKSDKTDQTTWREAFLPSEEPHRVVKSNILRIEPTVMPRE